MKNVDLKYFKELLHEVPAHLDVIDEWITPKLDRPFVEIDPIECAVMRLAVYELLHRIDIPYRVVINEAVELTKTFGAEDGFKYVNSIIDSLAKEIRKVEVNARRAKK
jgi:N utilization substance protein B